MKKVCLEISKKSLTWKVKIAISDIRMAAHWLGYFCTVLISPFMDVSNIFFSL